VFKKFKLPPSYYFSKFKCITLSISNFFLGKWAKKYTQRGGRPFNAKDLTLVYYLAKTLFSV
jgi:hypothetical protein